MKKLSVHVNLLRGEDEVFGLQVTVSVLTPQQKRSVETVELGALQEFAKGLEEPRC